MTKTPISTKEAAELLGVSDRTVLRMIGNGVLPGWKIIPGTKSVYRVWREDVERIIKQRESTAAKAS